jgi:NADPH-dependent glutamate synthase beta subunit-like oxidoreductase
MNNAFSITIDGRPVEVPSGESVLGAARRLGIDIPTLCYLEKCGPLNTCQVCLVKINGRLVPSCGTKVTPGMVIESETTEVHEARRTALELLFSDHVGDCLSPCQRLCPLMLNIPVMLRHIEAGRLSEANSTVRGALPLAGVLGRLCHHPCEQGCRRGHWDDPAAIRDMEKFVTDWERGLGQGNIQHSTSNIEHPIGAKEPTPDPSQEGNCPSDASSSGVLEPGRIEGEDENEGRRRSDGKSVVILGAGPTGLAAAFYLVREGHVVTVVDRRVAAGGTLRDVPESNLPKAVLDAEVGVLERLGVEFKLGAALGDPLTLDGLSRGFEAILVAVGELTAEEAAKLGLPPAGNALKTDPNTCLTPMARVFAAGSCVRPQKQLVKAMAEGRAVAECINRFLRGQPVRRPEKPFSSIMGRLDPAEVKAFLAGASSASRVSPCDACRGHSAREAATEGSRCLHCDCHSSGNCVLQHYAQVYGADAGRFRSERRKFEQQRQPGGILFEPGKCIVCGICVKLCEMAAEPLGLTFVGRGFDVRVAASLNAGIEAGLQKVADECVKQCPTGALVKG